MSEGRRRLPARIGIAALNLPVPGLGLVRLGRFRAAIPFLFAQLAALLFLLCYYAVAPELGFTAYAVSGGAVVLLVLGSVIGSAWLSWRWSADRERPLPVLSRWYSLAAIWVVSTLALSLLVDVSHRFYKPFYIPSHGMAPTLLKNDRMVASMRPVGEIRRGDVLLIDVGGEMYIKRVAGLPGDRIAMAGGKVVLNGEPVPLQLLGTEFTPSGPTRRMRERFPGEPAPHDVYDHGPSEFDDVPEQRVRPDHLFVLGDNRDLSADSRVPRVLMGVEQLPLADVRGRALFYTWGPSGRTGERIDLH